MKLYTYDHCPFCVRAKMAFGLHHIDYEEIVLLYDDEETPLNLVGKKAVPIVIKDDGTAMGESLDIVRFVDERAGGARLAEAVRPEVSAWLEDVRTLYTGLTAPREIRLSLPEFATQQALDYFINKKTPIYGDFADNWAQTATFLAEMNARLRDLAGLVQAPEHLGAKLGYEDILTFPLLRNLTMVRGLIFPAPLHAYVTTMSVMSQVPLYTARAV